MEVTHQKRPGNSLAAQAARELIVQFWLKRGRPPIDAQFLEDVKRELGKRFQDDAMSPASIARQLADQGAELRHPEIMEFDVRWREASLKDRVDKFAAVEQLSSGARLNIEDAGVLIGQMERLRQEFVVEDDDTRLNELRTMGADARQRAEAMAKNRKLDDKVRRQQSEIAEWLKVWLQTPTLFENWLELRRRSEEFRKKFPGGN